MPAREEHFIHRTGWLRAAVLGANDGIVSIASLVSGIAAAGVDRSEILLAGIAGLVGGALSMAAGEYVSVSSQADLERSERERERAAIHAAPEAELEELAAIYRARGVSAATARQVARELMESEPLEAHLRDELGITEHAAARPLQAAAASAASFALGGVLPVLAAALVTGPAALVAVPAVALAALAGLGATGARLGGAPVARAVARVVIGGGLAMAVTALAGALFGVAI